MAIFRKIHISFWSDPFISELKQEEKLFYIYLLTNTNTTQCGIYEITKKQIAFDLGYSIDRVSILLKSFYKYGKIRFNETTFELAIKNWNKYNDSTSPKVKVLVNKELEKIKDKLLIEYVYNIDTHLQQEQEEEQEEEEKPEKPKNDIPEFSEFFDFAKSLKEVYSPELDFSIKAKYQSWVDNNWKDGNGKQIKNWKTKLQNTIPYLKKVYKDKNDSGLSLAHTKAF
jgi:hypothetical protein